MNFTEAVNDVLVIVKRPDKTTEVQKAVNAALSFYVLKGGFRGDLAETSLPIDATLYGDTLDISALVRFRRFTYVKPTGSRFYLQPTAAEKIFEPGNSMQRNCYYTIGTNLTYVLASLSTALEVGYMQYAPVLSGTDTHWILDQAPQCVVDWAAAKIFRDIGDDSSADRHDAYAREFFKVLLNDQALGA
jgi:hypothetical protein